MKTVGVICEFDPVHRGHQWLLQEVRRRGAECIVCAMSGNFTQRGEAAAFDKLSRARMALAAGADLVLEMPTVWALSGAESFARGGAALLTLAGCTHIAFGSECGDLAALSRVAAALTNPAFYEEVHDRMTSGITFAAARQSAAEALLGPDGTLLRQPNNILAIEYLKAIAASESPLIAETVRRQGDGHDSPAAGEFASGSCIRELLRTGRTAEALALLPESSAAIVSEELSALRAPADLQRCDRAILAKLRILPEAAWERWCGGGEGLYHRLYQSVRQAASLAEVWEGAKTRRYPLSRLRRTVLRAWLEVPEPPAEIPYLRLLAANEAGRRQLRTLKKGGVPVLTKAADVSALGAGAETFFAREAAWTDLYDLARPQLSAPGGDWRITPYMRK